MAAHPSDAHLVAALVDARTLGDDDAVRAAAWALVLHHDAWIRTLHHRYTRRGDWAATAADDYLQELRITAARALTRYNSERSGVPAWIATSTRGVAARLDDREHPLTPPVGTHETLKAARRRGDTTPFAEAVARGIRSLDAPAATGDDTSGTYGEAIAADTVDYAARHTAAAQTRALHDVIDELLSPMERDVLVRHNSLDGEPAEHLSVIGARWGVTREAARLTERRAVSKLQHPIVLRRLARAG